MEKEISREQWNAMSSEQVESWMRWVMPQGAESPLPASVPDRRDFTSQHAESDDSDGAMLAHRHQGLDR